MTVSIHAPALISMSAGLLMVRAAVAKRVLACRRVRPRLLAGSARRRHHGGCRDYRLRAYVPY